MPNIFFFISHYVSGNTTLNFSPVLWGPFDIPTSHFSERFLFRTVFIPKGFYSERSFLRTVFSPLIRKAYNPKGHCSENLNSEMPLFRTVFYTKGFYSERFLSRTVLIPKGRFSEIRNKNLSDQKPFGSKNFYDVKKFS